MPEENLPKTWKSMFEQQPFLPVVVETIEKIHDINWSKEPSCHDHYEMLYLKKGEADFQIGTGTVVMRPNDLVIIKPYQTHKLTVRSAGGCELLALHFKFESNSSESSANFSEVSLNDFIEFVNDDSVTYVNIKLSRKNEIVSVMNRILREYDKQQIWGDYLCYLLIMELFILVSRSLKQDWELNTRSRSVKLRELLTIAKDYIDHNYDKEITLGDIAGYVFLSESYFAHMFRDEFMVSPKHYLLSVRIEAAKDLLANTDQKINDVAREVGFSSQQRFNDIFKKYEKMTPLKYRKIEKQKRINI